MPRLSLIAALSSNRVIGLDGGLPWKLPDDMAWFKAATCGHAVINGRGNFESEQSRPLPNRRNIIVTRQQGYQAEGVEVVSNLNEALTLIGDSDPEPFVIGGSSIYKLALPRVDRMYLTHIHSEVAGDRLFPEFDLADWDITDEREHPADDRHAYAMTFRTYDRREHGG
jgi:dihydrofolate reductase